jgi:hypothetical protein
MIKQWIERFKNWYGLRKINKWQNWEFIGSEWKVMAESPNHTYEVRMKKFVNIHTGQIELRRPTYLRQPRFMDKKDYRVTLRAPSGDGKGKP